MGAAHTPAGGGRPEDIDASLTFSAQRLAEFQLWESIESIVKRICLDPSPSVQNKLIMIHEVTRPDYRKDPQAALSGLRAVLRENASHGSFVGHLGDAVRTFQMYANVLAGGPAETPDSPRKIAVNYGGDDRF